jgi:hypothetical protein
VASWPSAARSLTVGTSDLQLASLSLDNQAITRNTSQ